MCGIYDLLAEFAHSHVVHGLKVEGVAVDWLFYGPVDVLDRLRQPFPNHRLWKVLGVERAVDARAGVATGLGLVEQADTGELGASQLKTKVDGSECIVGRAGVIREVGELGIKVPPELSLELVLL